MEKKCTLSISSKVGHIHNNKAIRGIDDPAVLLHRGFCCHSQPPSPLRQSWWAQPPHQGGGGEDGGLRDTDSKHAERERERDEMGVASSDTHTRSRITEQQQQDGESILPSSSSGKQDHLSFWVNYWRSRQVLRYSTQSEAETPQRNVGSRNPAWKRKDPSAPGTATMAPMVEEGSQLGESETPSNTSTHPALTVVLKPIFVVF